MERIQNAVYFAIGLALAIAVGYFWIGTGIFTGYVTPEAPEGFGTLTDALKAKNPQALQAAGWADLLSKSFEVIAAAATWSFGMALAILTPIARFITAKLYFAVHGTLPDAEPVEVEEQVSDPSLQLREDMVKLLLHSINEGDRSLTIKLCEKMHGEPYLTEKKTAPVVDDNGFPVKGN